ncbi:MAG TPA: membrane protein insertase YidC, partial [Pyrinomonadaceae bacterium]|nr:membrane protein insertase YidC [Pyrinomonadaceae bacterium]
RRFINDSRPPLVSNFMEQKRLLLAFTISAIILFGWSYLLPAPQAPQQNANTAATPDASPATPQPPDVETTADVRAGESAQVVDDNVAQRTVTVAGPLYEVQFDTRGAVAKSWVLKKNKDTGRPLCAIASPKGACDDLQLIPTATEHAEFAPLRLVTGRADLDAALANKNYSVSGASIAGETGDARVELSPGQSQEVKFVMQDAATGLQVTKTLTFDAEQYIVGLKTEVAQNGQRVPNVRMVVGPSVGDQSVPQYTFYSVAPEGVAALGDDSFRLRSAEIAQNEQSEDAEYKKSQNFQELRQPVDWAAIGDTYFAMALVLPEPAAGVQFHTKKFPAELSKQEERFFVTSLVPVPASDAPAYLFVGPKDHFALEETSGTLSQLTKRPVDLEGLIDYGWLGFTRPIAVQLLKAIKYLNDLTGNYGVAIIIFTVIIYMLFFPLKWRSSKAMKRAQRHAPRMKEIQEKMKGLKANDPRLKELQMEQLRLMKEANPLGGCLPLLIQMPFLIALYSAITISIDFRRASFLWMPDLSASDPIHLLPILMAASMVVLQLSTPAPSADPLQRKMMAVILPVMMLYMLWSAPSGLLVYWFVGNLVGFGQQLLINRLIKSEDDQGPPPEKDKAEKRPKKNLNTPSVSQARG